MASKSNPFRISTTTTLTLLLLLLMVTAGLLSASWGIAFGRRALMGVTQPDANGTWNTNAKANGASAKPGTTNPQRGQPALLNEQQVIEATVSKLKVVGKAQGAGSSLKRANRDSDLTNLPRVSSNQGITLEVRSVRRRGENLELGIQLQNSGDRTVRFLYSLMDVTNDQGQVLGASAQDLPGELPPTGQSYEGTVLVPVSELRGVKTLSVRLTDYPEQRLRLQVEGIPAQQPQ